MDVLPPPRRAGYRTFSASDGSTLDAGLVLRFPAPRSFTGENVVELQGHGGPVVLQMLLDEILSQGVRLARPGEFTERAFLNGKLDLPQAEAVADLIAGTSRAAVRAANRSLAGEFSQRVHGLEADVVRLRTFVEAAIDFADEDIDLLRQEDITARIETALGAVLELRAKTAQGVLLRDGITLALLGAPNVGKSSLLNRLTGEERAIVTDVAGTTRDLVRVPLQLAGLPLELVDTAGLRDSDDPVELEGVRRARRAAEEADLVLWVGDLDNPGAPAPELPPGIRLIKVWNKVDLTPLEAGPVAECDPPEVRVSAATGAGIAELTQEITRAVGFAPAEGAFTARQRHVQALDRAAQALRGAARDAVELELAAEELKLAHQALGEIVGEMTPDELLGEIFSTFCIGK